MDRSKHPIVHFVGSIPLPDSETVFRDLSAAVGPRLTRLPDGETGIRKTWIRFLQDVLAENPAIEFAQGVPPFQFVQWDGKVVREIPRLRVKPGATVDGATSAPATPTWRSNRGRCSSGCRSRASFPAGVKFQICIPTPIAPTYNNMVPGDRPKLLPALTQHFIGEVAKIAKTLPNDRIAIQWDVCQEVLAWENYYDKGPVDFRTETIDVLTKIGDGVPAGIELGYHLCYGSPADEHMVLPKDQGIMVEMTNAIAAGVKRPIQFFHMPVIKARTDDAYFAPLKGLKLGSGHRALSRSHPSRRRPGQRGAARGGAPSRPRRRRRHRMRHGARRSVAAAGAARGARRDGRDPRVSVDYSIVLSARSRIDPGTSIFSARAVRRFTASSNLVGCSTGRLAGFLRAAPDQR